VAQKPAQKARRTTAAGCALLLALASATCSSEEERAPALAECSSCGPDYVGTVAGTRTGTAGSAGTASVPSGSAGTAGVTGTAGATGTGGTGSAGNGPERELAGRVLVMSRGDLSAAREPGTPVRVAVAGDANQNTNSDGAGLFRWTVSSSANPLWLDVRSPDSLSEWFPTLQPVPADGSSLALNVFETALLEVFAGAYLNSPLQFEPARAHVVARFTNALGVPRAGISLLDLGSGSERVAYDAGDTYSDALVATDQRGVAIVLNLEPANAGALALRFQAEGGAPQEQLLRVAAGSVTWVTVAIP
jgi:hypothetical protein